MSLLWIMMILYPLERIYLVAPDAAPVDASFVGAGTPALKLLPGVCCVCTPPPPAPAGFAVMSTVAFKSGPAAFFTKAGRLRVTGTSCLPAGKLLTFTKA
jgi:hypothetical protein